MAAQMFEAMLHEGDDRGLQMEWLVYKSFSRRFRIRVA